MVIGLHAAAFGSPMNRESKLSGGELIAKVGEGKLRLYRLCVVPSSCLPVFRVHIAYSQI
jgi:hypothetical protein